MHQIICAKKFHKALTTQKKIIFVCFPVFFIGYVQRIHLLHLYKHELFVLSICCNLGVNEEIKMQGFSKFFGRLFVFFQKSFLKSTETWRIELKFQEKIFHFTRINILCKEEQNKTFFPNTCQFVLFTSVMFKGFTFCTSSSVNYLSYGFVMIP